MLYGVRCVFQTYIIMAKMRKHLKPLLQKHHHLIRHLTQLMQIAIPIHITKPRPYGIIHKHDIRKLVPAPVIVLQLLAILPRLHAVGPDLHHGAVFGTAAWPAVKPDYGALPVRDVTVLEVPEEEVGVCGVVDFDEPVGRLAVELERKWRLGLPSVHLQQWPFWRAR